MIRRVLFATIWFVIISLAVLVIGAGIAGGRAGAQHAEPTASFREGFQDGYQMGAVAGAEFRARYKWHILAASAVLVAAGTATGFLPGTRK
jgi:hypothetical protein